MSKPTKLDAAQHLGLHVSADAAVRFAEGQHVMWLRAAEVARAVAGFPVFFNRSETTGLLSVSAMTSFTPGTNLFVENGAWHGIFTPSAMKTYPLALMHDPDDARNYTVGIDAGSPVLSEEDGESLFETNGKPSPFLERTTALLEADIEHDIQTAHFTQRVEQLGLQRPISVHVQYANDEVHTLTGLAAVDEDALHALETEQLIELHRKGYLATLHAMLISMFQLNRLIRRHNRRDGLARVKNVKLEVERDAATGADGIG